MTFGALKTFSSLVQVGYVTEMILIIEDIETGGKSGRATPDRNERLILLVELKDVYVCFEGGFQTLKIL